MEFVRAMEEREGEREISMHYRPAVGGDERKMDEEGDGGYKLLVVE